MKTFPLTLAEKIAFEQATQRKKAVDAQIGALFSEAAAMRGFDKSTIGTVENGAITFQIPQPDAEVVDPSLWPASVPEEARAALPAPSGESD